MTTAQRTTLYHAWLYLHLRKLTIVEPAFGRAEPPRPIAAIAEQWGIEDAMEAIADAVSFSKQLRAWHDSRCDKCFRLRVEILAKGGWSHG